MVIKKFESVKIGGTLFPFVFEPGGKSRTALNGLVGKARRERSKLQKDLKSAANGKKKLASQHAYWGSQWVRFHVLVQAAKRRPFGDRRTIEYYLELAAQLKIYKPIKEPVFVTLKEKPSGGVRPICKFGVRHHAAQMILNDLVGAQFDPEPYQYNVRNKGVGRAIQRTRTLFAQGYIHCLKLDIKKFYDTFAHDGLLKSNLADKGIIESVAIGRHYKLKWGGDDYYKTYPYKDYIVSLTSAGIPQGSACSPSIGNFYVSKLKPKLPVGSALINYADDFLLLGKSVHILSNAKSALGASITALTVGDFELLEKSSGSFTKGLDFLGHRLLSEGNALNVTIPQSTQDLLGESFIYPQYQLNTLRSALDEASGDAAERLQAEYIDCLCGLVAELVAWKKSFQHADNVDQVTGEFFDTIADYAGEVGMTLDEIILKSKTFYAQNALSYW